VKGSEESSNAWMIAGRPNINANKYIGQGYQELYMDSTMKIIQQPL